MVRFKIGALAIRPRHEVPAIFRRPEHAIGLVIGRVDRQHDILNLIWPDILVGNAKRFRRCCGPIFCHVVKLEPIRAKIVHFGNSRNDLLQDRRIEAALIPLDGKAGGCVAEIMIANAATYRRNPASLPMP